MSVASTGLGERGGLGGVMLAPGGAWAGCSTNRDESPPPRDLHLGSKSVARARSTVRISDADPLVHLQTFAAFITCCSRFLPFRSRDYLDARLGFTEQA